PRGRDSAATAVRATSREVRMRTVMLYSRIEFRRLEVLCVPLTKPNQLAEYDPVFAPERQRRRDRTPRAGWRQSSPAPSLFQPFRAVSIPPRPRLRLSRGRSTRFPIAWPAWEHLAGSIPAAP